MANIHGYAASAQQTRFLSTGGKAGDFLVGQFEATFEESAGYSNALYTYDLDDNGMPINLRQVIANTNDPNAQMLNDIVFTDGKPNLMLLANGAGKTPDLVYNNGVPEVWVDGKKYCKAYFTNENWNADGQVHFRVQDNSEEGILKINVEDLWGGGDNDFNDLVLTLDYGPETTSNPDPTIDFLRHNSGNRDGDLTDLGEVAFLVEEGILEEVQDPEQADYSIRGKYYRITETGQKTIESYQSMHGEKSSNPNPVISFDDFAKHYGFLEEHFNVNGLYGLNEQEIEALVLYGVLEETDLASAEYVVDGKGYKLTEYGKAAIDEFKRLDTNGDGYLAEEEFVENVMMAYVPQSEEEDESEVEERVRQIYQDLGGDDGVNFQGFERLVRFMSYDKNGDFLVERDEFVSSFEGQTGYPGYYENLYDNVLNADKQGGVTFGEYMEFQKLSYEQRDFMAYDANGDNKWSRAEYNDWYGDTFGGPIFDSADAYDGKDGKISDTVAVTGLLGGDTAQYQKYNNGPNNDGDSASWSRREFNQWVGDTYGGDTFESVASIDDDDTTISFEEFTGPVPQG